MAIQISSTTVIDNSRNLTNIANATTSATANSFVLRGADGKICSDSVSLPTIPGGPAEGGYLICKGGSGLYWIVAPAASEVSRCWDSRNDANTTAQSVSGCTGWFVPTCAQLQNPGYCCRTLWDRYSNSGYWTSTEYVANQAWRVRFDYANTYRKLKIYGYCVRSFRCVTY